LTSPLRARLLLIAAAVLFSTGGAAIKAPALTGWQIAAFRSGIATIFLLAAVPETRRGWSLRMLPVAACYAATLVSFVLANRLTTAANTIFLQSTAPLYVLLLGPFVLHEPIRRRDLAFVAAVCAGIACFFAGSAPAAITAPDPHRGNLIAILSGLFYALMLIGLRFLARGSAHQTATATVALGNLLACLAALPMALPTAAISTRDFSALLYLGTVQIGIAYLCLVRGMRHVRAVEASALLMVEPALNPIWTWLVHGETPAVWSIAGGLLILGASFYNAASKT